MRWGVPRESWFINQNYGQYQRCNGRVTCYVEKMLFIYRANLYIRGPLGLCELEARVGSGGDPKPLFEITEKWLELYSDGDLERMHENDPFSIQNPKGVWGPFKIHEKMYYLDENPNWRELYR